MRNQFRKAIKCELRQFYFPKTNYPRCEMRRAKAISISHRQKMSGLKHIVSPPQLEVTFCDLNYQFNQFEGHFFSLKDRKPK